MRKEPLTTEANHQLSPQTIERSLRHHGIVSREQEDARSHADDRSKPFQSTYYDARMRASPALLRARAPYLLKNTITGFAICSLVIGICKILEAMCADITYLQCSDTYTINAISQDEFEDVIVPDEPIVRSQQPAGTTAAVQQAVAARK